MIVKLPWQGSSVPVDLRGLTVRHLRPVLPSRSPEPAVLTAEALDRPLDGEPLDTRCRGSRTVTVVVPDATRGAALPEVLPVVLERLARAGVSDDGITVLVACGTHPPVTSEELARLLGPLPPSVRVVQHDCRDADGLVTVGELRPGLPLRLNRLVTGADAVVTIGTVRHHYFAGFGGGPKMIFPGVAGYEEIQQNHARVLAGVTAEGEPQLDPRCAPGVLAGNPVAEEIACAAEQLPPTLALCFAPGGEGRPGWAGAGSWRTAFSAAVERVREWYEVGAGRFRLLVASGGGAPSDATLIQAHKGLDAVCRFAVPGAEVLYVAAIGGGLGSAEMVDFVDDPRPGAILERLRSRWVQYGHTTLRLVDKAARYRVHLCSSLDPEISRRLGFLPTVDPGSVVEGWRERFPGEAVAVIAGSAVYPREA